MARELVFRHESLEEVGRVAELLQEVQRGLEAGELDLSSGEQEIVLKPDHHVRLVVQVRTDETRTKLMLSVSWHQPLSENTVFSIKPTPPKNAPVIPVSSKKSKTTAVKKNSSISGKKPKKTKSGKTTKSATRPRKRRS